MKSLSFPRRAPGGPGIEPRWTRGAKVRSVLRIRPPAECGTRLMPANSQEAVLSYQQTVQNALEQVSNSLIASQKDREFREQQELLTQAAQQTDQLSEMLYKNGGASYLQVLTSETNYSEKGGVHTVKSTSWRSTHYWVQECHTTLLRCRRKTLACFQSVGKAAWV
jgi:hypothetical protein